MNYPRQADKYLSKNGLNSWKLETAEQKYFSNIIVIPAVDEYENIEPLLESIILNDEKYFSKTLLVFVVNNLASSGEAVRRNNRKSLELLRTLIHGRGGTDLHKRFACSGLTIGVVDASGPGSELPEKEGGVGLARKIGMDLALRQFDYSNNGAKILICLDADCTVERNYLSSIVEEFQKPGTCAAYVQYEHLLPDAEPGRSAIICYEIFLRYYLLGLKYADSPFAFPTVGSTMICDYESYIKIGGMNKKKAAEDFYFMEKLAKIVPIKKIGSTKVYPSSRGSWRVPFGTGQRVNRYFAGTHEEYLLYNPASFEILKRWLKYFNSDGARSADEYLNGAETIDKSLRGFLIQNEFGLSWEKIARSSKSGTQIEKQKMLWFDGFRTLRLIHHLRDKGYPASGMFDALDKLFNMMNFDQVKSGIERNVKIPPVEVQIKYLNLLRELT